MNAPLLEVEGLRVALATAHGPAFPVDGVDLRVEAEECVGLLGESGCGKTLLALAVMGLLPPAARVAAGSVRLGGEELAGAPRRTWNRLRGASLAMVFQEPGAALHPAFSAGTQVAEVLRVHRRLGRAEAWRRAVAMLERVGLPDPGRVALARPHELSGGMQQRVMLAMALVAGPRLLVADEPTTALDVTTQAQILALLDELRREMALAVLWISHDLRVLARLCGRLAVMYAGRIAEEGRCERVLAAPRHPYTAGLLRALPSWSRRRLPEGIPGRVPEPYAWPQGCRFRPRCALARPRCEEVPPLFEHAPGQRSACHFWDRVESGSGAAEAGG